MASRDSRPGRSALRAGLDRDQTRDDLLRALTFASPPIVEGSVPVRGFSARAWARVATKLTEHDVEYGPADVSWFVADSDVVQASALDDGLTLHRLPHAAATASERLGSFDADRVAFALVELCAELSDGDADRAEQRQLETDLPALFAAGSVSHLYDLKLLADAKPRYLPVLYRTLVLLARRLYRPGDTVLTVQERAASTYLTFATRHPAAGENVELLSRTLGEHAPAAAGEPAEDTLGFRVRLALGWMHVGQLLASHGRRRPAAAASRAALRGYERLAADHSVYRKDVARARRQLRAHRWWFIRPRSTPTRADAASPAAVAKGAPPPGWATVAPILAGLACIVAGVVAWPLTGHGRWALVGLAAAAALTSGALHYRQDRMWWPRTVPAIDGGYADVRDLLLAWLPEFRVALTVGLPSAIGVAISASGGDWRWSVTGLVIGAAVPPVADEVGVAWATLTTDTDADFPFAFGILLGVAGTPIALLSWLWTGRAVDFLVIGGIALGGALLMFAMSVAARIY